MRQSKMAFCAICWEKCTLVSAARIELYLRTFRPNLSALDLLEYLYSVGIIENTWRDYKNNRNMHRSIFRNEGDFDRNLLLRILPAVWSGITV